MKKLLLSFALTALTIAPALAADPMPGSALASESPRFFGYIEGAYLFDEAGTGAWKGFNDEVYVNAGDGWSGGAHFGYQFIPGWDVSSRFRVWSHGSGDSDGDFDPNEYGIERSRGFHVDAQLGRAFNVGPSAELRGFLGVRYLEWKQENGFRPDVPLGCCFLNSDTWGIGPVVGVDGVYAVTPAIGLIAGADVAVLFGRMSYEGGTSEPSGRDDRTMVNAGAYVGAQYQFSENIALSAGYRGDIITNATFSNQNLFSHPEGDADIITHGPFLRLSFKWGG